MALTANQRRILLELVHEKINDILRHGDSADLGPLIVQIAEATEAQVVTRIQQYAGTRKAAIQAQRDTLSTTTLARYDADIAFYDGED